MPNPQVRACIMPEKYLPTEIVEDIPEGQQRYMRTSGIIVIRDTKQVFVSQLTEVTTQMPPQQQIYLYCILGRRNDKHGTYFIRILVPELTVIQYSELTIVDVYDTHYVPISSIRE